MPAFSLDLTTLSGGNGFIVEGADIDDNLGSALSIFGDFNGDGFDDIVAVAPNADPDGRDRAGEAYVIFGGPGRHSLIWTI